MAKKFTYDHPRPMLTADAALFRLNGEKIEILMVKRGRPPHKGSWVLPGGFVDIDEPLEAAAVRELREETGIKNIPFMVQIGAYGNPHRDPRGRVVSVAYAGIVPAKGAKPRAGDDAAEAQWFPIESVPDRIAFDHAGIIGDALRRIATLGRTSGALFVFLGDTFTRDQVRTLLKALYGVTLDPDEYIATFMEMGLVRKTRSKSRYRFASARVSARAPRKPSKKAKSKKTPKPKAKTASKRKTPSGRKKPASKPKRKKSAAKRKTSKKQKK